MAIIWLVHFKVFASHTMERFLIGFILLGLTTHNVNGQTTFNTYVCSPANVTEPLECSSEQWVHILQEIYSPTSDRTTSCEPNFTSCSAVYYDTDLVANCNGPTTQGLEACREETSVDLAKHNMPCLHTATNITTSVQYSCIDKSSVLDLCGASSVIKSNFQTVNAYLASPNFPKATPTGTLCLCTIQGIKVKMTAMDVNVQAKLPWESIPTMNNDPYGSVFSVSSVGDGVLWQSSQCTDCSTQHILNSNLFMPLSEDSSTVSVTYSDFGLYGQNVWVEVIGQGSTLNVTCTSEPLPPNRIITTTTSTSSTAKTTTATTMVPTTEPATIPTTTTTTANLPTTTATTIPPTTATTPKTVTTTPTIPASLTTTTPSVAVYPSTISSIRMTQQSTTSSPGVLTTKSMTAPSIDDLRGNKSKNDSTALIITLVCILLVLVIIAVVVGFLVYRKRRKFTYNGKVGLKALFLSLYHQITNREMEKTDYHDSPFDPIAMDYVNQPYAVDTFHPCSEDNKNKHRSDDQNEAEISPRSCSQLESENESNLNGMADKQKDSPVNIYNEIDQSGGGIVDAEIETMQKLRNKKTNKASFENSHSASDVSGNMTVSEQGNGRNYFNPSHDDHDQRNLTTGNRRVNATETNGHIGFDELQTLGSSKAAEIKNKLDVESKKHWKSKRDEPKGDKSKGDELKKDGNLKHSKQLHDQMLDSPEEEKIIASPGLPAVGTSSESVPDISNTAVRRMGLNDDLYSHVDKKNSKENFSNRKYGELQNNTMTHREVDAEKIYSLAKPVQPGALESQKSVTGKKKMSRSDLVSTILQSTLQDIKQMRTNDQQKDDLTEGGENESLDLSKC